MVSAVRADATEVPMSVYPLQGGKVHPNFENKKIFLEKSFFSLNYDQKNTLNPLVKSISKSVDN